MESVEEQRNLSFDCSKKTLLTEQNQVKLVHSLNHKSWTNIIESFAAQVPFLFDLCGQCRYIRKVIEVNRMW